MHSDNIHTHPEEGHWESYGGRGFSKDKRFYRKEKLIV